MFWSGMIAGWFFGIVCGVGLQCLFDAWKEHREYEAALAQVGNSMEDMLRTEKEYRETYEKMRGK